MWFRTFRHVQEEGIGFTVLLVCCSHSQKLAAFLLTYPDTCPVSKARTFCLFPPPLYLPPLFLSRAMFSPPPLVIRIQYLWLRGALSWLPEQIPLDPLTGSVLITECWVRIGLNFSSSIFWGIRCTTQIFIHTVHTVQLCVKQSHYIHLLGFTRSFPVLITGKLSLISQSSAGEW